MQPVHNKIELRPQTRQLREAGASTYSDKVVMNNSQTEKLAGAESDQTNKFKPANETSAGGNINSEDKLNTKPSHSDAEGSHENSKRPGLTKSRSFGTSNCQLRERCPKNSTINNMNGIQASKSVEGTPDLKTPEDMLINNGTNSSHSLTASTGEEITNKRKADVKANQSKSSRKLTHPRQKDAKSANGTSERSDEDSKSNMKARKSACKKEEVCLNWIKSLSELEQQSNMEFEQNHGDEEPPEFCTNRICPISEHKIAKTPKVLKQCKKVVLRKTLFEDDDERWYCIRCLKAHNHSLFCFYCGQIYFVDESELEDDGKPWICCDKCDKWVSIPSIIGFI